MSILLEIIQWDDAVNFCSRRLLTRHCHTNVDISKQTGRNHLNKVASTLPWGYTHLPQRYTSTVRQIALKNLEQRRI